MTSRFKVFFSLTVLLAVGLVVIWWATPGDPGGVIPTEAEDEYAMAEGRNDLRGKGAEGRDGETIEAGGERVDLAVPESGQGIHGRVVSPSGQPVAGARTFLVRGIGRDAFEIMARVRDGETIPHIAEAITGDRGRFRLGVATYDERRGFEVHILHPAWCDHRIPSLAIQPRDWFDAGDIVLRTGAAVFGTLTSDTGLPIAGATVRARALSGFQFAPPPGREDGITTTTDDRGAYEIRHLDPTSTFALEAEASDFARESKEQPRLEPDKRHRIDFTLVPGMRISGIVVGPRGTPIEGAKLTVAALSQKSQQVETTRSDSSGAFVASGLRDGPYAIIAEASGFIRSEDKPVPAGKKDVQIVMENQGSVHVTVISKDGRPQRDFQCNLKAVLEGQSAFGNAILSKKVTGATNGTVIIKGVDPMTYVAEVHAKGHAKKYSDRFEITEGQREEVRVTVRLDEGGSLRGVVRDGKGTPVAGVKVATQQNGFIKTPFSDFFPVPFTISRGSVVTNRQGEYRLRLLVPGTYQLELEHADFCAHISKDHVVVAGPVTRVGDTVLHRGCVVTGVARLDGTPTGQLKVSASAIADPKNPTWFSIEAVSDNEGKFLLGKRLQPGTYEFRCMRQSQSFLGLIDAERSKRTVVIARGDGHRQLFLDIPTR